MTSESRDWNKVIAVSAVITAIIMATSFIGSMIWNFHQLQVHHIDQQKIAELTAQLIEPRPDVYFVRERCAIIPTGTNATYVKLVVNNKGGTKELSLEFKVKPSYPYIVKRIFFANTSEIFDLAAGESAMRVVVVEDPTVPLKPGGYIEIEATIKNGEIWDTYVFSEWW
jgi:hypothetical protein